MWLPMSLKTLKITAKTHEALTKIKGLLMAKTGKETTYDDAIMWLISKVKLELEAPKESPTTDKDYRES